MELGQDEVCLSSCFGSTTKDYQRRGSAVNRIAAIMVLIGLAHGEAYGKLSSITLRQLIARSDLVVVGKIEFRENSTTISVDEVLKGACGNKINIRVPSSNWGCGPRSARRTVRQALDEGQQKIFLLISNKSGFSPFRGECVQDVSKKDKIQSFIKEMSIIPKDWRAAVYDQRDQKTGVCWLRANGSLMRGKEPRVFKFIAFWKYNVDQQKWIRIRTDTPEAVRVDTTDSGMHFRNNDQFLMKLTDQIGLFWVKWEEDGYRVEKQVFSGPVMCNDIMIGPPAEGMIATCIPGENFGRAAHVPDPRVHCGGR